MEFSLFMYISCEFLTSYYWDFWWGGDCCGSGCVVATATAVAAAADVAATATAAEAA